VKPADQEIGVPRKSKYKVQGAHRETRAKTARNGGRYTGNGKPALQMNQAALVA